MKRKVYENKHEFIRKIFTFFTFFLGKAENVPGFLFVKPKFAHWEKYKGHIPCFPGKLNPLNFPTIFPKCFDYFTFDESFYLCLISLGNVESSSTSSKYIREPERIGVCLPIRTSFALKVPLLNLKEGDVLFTLPIGMDLKGKTGM